MVGGGSGEVGDGIGVVSSADLVLINTICDVYICRYKKTLMAKKAAALCDLQHLSLPPTIQEDIRGGGSRTSSNYDDREEGGNKEKDDSDSNNLVGDCIHFTSSMK